MMLQQHVGSTPCEQSGPSETAQPTHVAAHGSQGAHLQAIALLHILEHVTAWGILHCNAQVLIREENLPERERACQQLFERIF